MKDTEILILSSSQCLIVANSPDEDKVNFGELSDKILHAKKDDSFEQFGFFETTAPNFQTFYPNLTAEDLVPKESDFIHPVFRGLSETTVKGNLTDFSKNGVLKKSMGLLKGQTLYANHEVVVGGHIGVVEGVYWQEAYDLPNGLKVPAGINVKLKIDGKSQPNIARAINMDPPALHSVSVTISFEWEQSHPKMAREEFWSKFGQKIDGEVVRKVATKILRYYEISLVPHGADIFAKKVGDDKKILAGNIAKSFQSFGLDANNASYVGFNFKDFTTELNSLTIPISLNKNDNQIMDLTKIANKLGLAGTEITEDALMAHLDTVVSNIDASKLKIEELGGQISTLTSDKNELTTKLATATSDLTTEKNNAAEGKKTIEAFRATTVANYTKLKGDKKDTAILNLLATANYDTLQSLNNDYTVQLEAEFPLTCKDCNSTNVNRSSSASKGEGEGGKAKVAKTAEDLHAERNQIKLHE